MASVRSLGLHRPAGLRHAIEESLLPDDPMPSTYSWTIVTDDHGVDPGEDELLTTKTSVVWCRGSVFRKTFSFTIENEPITQALLAYFNVSQDARHPQALQRDRMNRNRPPAIPRLEKALVVFLKTQAHIFFLSGPSHVVHIPFEVESACAGPVGVIIQRKPGIENTAPISLRFPRVPPNSFVSSQLTAMSSSQQDAFSVEHLANPKPLHFGLNSMLDSIWEAPSQSQSRWPRLVSLTEPLADIGLVVSEPRNDARRSSGENKAKNSCFLNPAEEILHIEQIDLPGVDSKELTHPLMIGVTINRESGTYTIWSIKYLNKEDLFIGDRKKAKSKGSRRKSSMPAPSFRSGTATPVQQSLRESFGAPLPGKRQRKKDKIEKQLDLVSSIEQQEIEGSGTRRRRSRRVSSMLARADLSASQERSIFAEHPQGTSSMAGKRGDSLGSLRIPSGSSFPTSVHPSLGSLLDAPIDIGLDEEFHNMGLEDYELDGLQHEIQFTEIQKISLDSSHLRYPSSLLLAQSQIKIFILTAPSFAVDQEQRTQLLIGIQEPLEKRLQMMNLFAKTRENFAGTDSTPDKKPIACKCVQVSAGQQWKVQNVIDSSKLIDDGLSAILVLSDSKAGQRELSAQAPWIELTNIPLNISFVEDVRNMQYRHGTTDRASRVRGLTASDIVGIRHSRSRGVIDVVDGQGRLHKLQIRLQPTCPQAKKVLDICKSVLPEALGCRIHAGWLHIMQWLQKQPAQTGNMEWSAVTVLLFASFLNLGRDKDKPMAPLPSPSRKRRAAAASLSNVHGSENWRKLEAAEAEHSLAHPLWMINRGWRWAMEEDEAIVAASYTDSSTAKFLPRHIRLAKEYLRSPQGNANMGIHGYMPTSLARSPDTQRKVAVDIFMAMHLLLDEQKLDITTPEYTSPGRTDLRVLLCQIARWLKWHAFASIYQLGIQEDVDASNDMDLNPTPAIPQPTVRPDILEWIQCRLSGVRGKPCLIPADIYYANSRIPEAERSQDRRWHTLTPRTIMFRRLFTTINPKSTAVEMVEAMYDCGITNAVLETLPEAISVPLQDAISFCQPRPPVSWNKDLLHLVARSDMSLVTEPGRRPHHALTSILVPTHMSTWDFRMLCKSAQEVNKTSHDDIEETERQAVIQSLFKDDRRLNEAQDLLSTHRTRVVRLNPEQTWSESEYLEKQKELVSTIAIGTLAVPTGRALLNFSLRYPIITQKLVIGGFNLLCVVKPTNTTVGVEKSLFTEEKVCWGFFHQGVAAGLAISPQAKGIDSSWILYNKPAQEPSNRHAGFLLALGLNGHLKGLAKWVTFRYLTTKHTMTSIGLLLGLAASYLGTMDSLITRVLSLHATRMLPRGAAELNLAPLTQTCGIMGLGLVYCNSQHRRMSEIMLSEIENTEEEDQEEPLKSECYRLAAGYALGLINLGRGSDLKGLHDMKLTERLMTRATAIKSVEIVHILDRASAGAVMAIALIFMKSEDQFVARKIDVPDSIIQFDYVRPDILLLRSIAKNLILWSKIEPSLSWIRDSLPLSYRYRHTLENVRRLYSADLPFFNILAGHCFSIALRYAGSASIKVRDLLVHYLDQFMRISNINPVQSALSTRPTTYDEELARSTARACQDILALACAIVMAGTGDITVLRRLRSLHGRDKPDISYGSHLAAHLAIGTLFLGCGTVTFGTSNMATAALLIAFYPILPNNVMDNHSHLQAFRHFWVLATEHRCLVAKDLLTGQPISVPVQIKMSQESFPEHVLERTTPCLLPPLDHISHLSTSCGPQFWDLDLDFSNEDLRAAFAQTQTIHLRRRPPREATLASTLRTLGSDNKGRNPLNWFFQLDNLRGASWAEKAAYLECDELEQEACAAFDARMEMQRGIEEGGDRERLEGVRLLFEWGAARDRLLRREKKNSEDGQAAGEAGSSREGEVTGSNAASHDSTDNVWWMNDSAIEALKAQVWLAVQRGEQ